MDHQVERNMEHEMETGNPKPYTLLRVYRADTCMPLSTLKGI